MKESYEEKKKILDKETLEYKATIAIVDPLVENVPNYHEKDWNLTVVKSKKVNAFVLPDGSIFVMTGLLELVDDADELAAVIGHELSHVHLRHAVSQASMYVLALSGLAFLEFYLLGDVSRMSAIATSLFFKLPMSRRHEIEADRCGIYFSGEAGFKPESAITLFDKFSQIEAQAAGGQDLALINSYLSTHPKGEERVKAATDEAAEFRKNTDDKLWAKIREEKVNHILKLFEQVKNAQKSRQAEAV